MTTLFAAVRPKRSETPGVTPLSAALRVGEIATNLADGRIYSKRSDGTIISVGGGQFTAGTGNPLVQGFQAGKGDGEVFLRYAAAGPGTDLARLYVWDQTGQAWAQAFAAHRINQADDLASVAPSEGQLLTWDAVTSKWTPTPGQQVALRRSATAVTGTITMDGGRAYQLLAWSGVNPKASFGAGVEGVQVQLLNRSTNPLELLAGAGGSFATGSGFGFVRPGGGAVAFYTGGSWSVSGDLYDPGVLTAFDLEDAQDYAQAGSKANGDLLAWDAVAGKFTTRPLDYAAIETQIEAGLLLGQLANVTITSQTDQQYLRYNATAGQWEGQPLPLDQIAEDVQLRTNLGELANVVITGPSGQDLLAYNASTGAWVNIPGGDVTAKADKLAEFRQVPADTTLAATDSTRVIEVVNAAVVTLPSNVSVGFQVVIVRAGTGEVEIVATTVNSADGNRFLRSQYSTATCLHKGAGVWYVFGDLKAETGP